MARLLMADPGLPRRFRKKLHLQDYSAQALAQIAEKVAKSRFDFSFKPGLVKVVDGAGVRRRGAGEKRALNELLSATRPASRGTFCRRRRSASSVAIAHQRCLWR